jgi:3-hydroxyisobutyrate dehydrogenase/2-hydroxy-3-oxopropionate reductase
MARNLIRAGHEVALWSNSASKAKELAEAKHESGSGIFCATPREVAAHADCIFLCVGNGDMSEKVVLGENGLSAGAKPGTVIADASTVSPSQSRRMGEQLSELGIHFLDAPCTGSTPGATKGTLTFMIGGDKAVFDGVRKYFEPMGKNLYYCGGPGMGLQAKLSQNLVLCNIMQAFSEGIVLAAKGGVDPKLMLEILTNSAAKSGLIDYKAPFIFKRDFTTNFSVKWMHKDIGLMLESGEELNVPLPLTALTRQIFQAAISTGHGDEDFCSTIKVLEEMAGLEVRSE